MLCIASLYIALEAFGIYLMLRVIVLELCFCWMFWMLYTSLLWYLFDLHMLMMLDILNCFVMWFRCRGSWVWACPLELIQFYARNMFFVTLLWVKRSGTSRCFIFILNLVFIFCLLPICNFYSVAYYGKPVVRICSLYWTLYWTWFLFLFAANLQFF